MITLFEKFKFYKKGLNISYSAVVLDQSSKNLLLSTFIYPNPNYSEWLKSADHMTICLGELPEHLKRYWLDEDVTLTVTELGYNDLVIAVKVSGFFNVTKPFQLENEGPKYPHVTLAFNPIGGKPSLSNTIEKWKEIEPINLTGTVKEIAF